MNDLLTAELAEINSYVRMYVQTYVAWFTFFITVLFTAMAWALRAAFTESRRLKWGRPVYLVYTLFSVQLIMGMLATYAIREDLALANARIVAVQSALFQSKPIEPHSPVPASLSLSMSLMGVTLISNLIFWGAVAGYVRHLEKHR